MLLYKISGSAIGHTPILPSLIYTRDSVKPTNIVLLRLISYWISSSSQRYFIILYLTNYYTTTKLTLYDILIQSKAKRKEEKIVTNQTKAVEFWSYRYTIICAWLPSDTFYLWEFNTCRLNGLWPHDALMPPCHLTSTTRGSLLSHKGFWHFFHLFLAHPHALPPSMLDRLAPHLNLEVHIALT